jgi:hypothetical protein
MLLWVKMVLRHNKYSPPYVVVSQMTLPHNKYCMPYVVSQMTLPHNKYTITSTECPMPG